MANYRLEFDSVSIPSNSGGISVTVQEDVNSDATIDNTETISLTNGVSEYVTSSGAFAGNGDVSLDFELGPPTDVSTTASTFFPVLVTAEPVPPREWVIRTKNNGNIFLNYVTTNATNIKRGDVITINVDSSNYALLQDYIEYAGSYKTLEGLNGEVFYNETVPSSAEIDSLVLGIEPNTDLTNRDIRGIWGIIDSATDNRNRSLTTNQIGVNLLVLAEYSDYADHTALSGALEMNV